MDQSPPGVFGDVKGWRGTRGSGVGVPAEPRVSRPGASRGGVRGGAGGVEAGPASGRVETLERPGPGERPGRVGEGREPRDAGRGGGGSRAQPTYPLGSSRGRGSRRGRGGRAVAAEPGSGLAARQPPQGPRCSPSGSPAGEQTAPRPGARGVPPVKRSCFAAEGPCSRARAGRSEKITSVPPGEENEAAAASRATFPGPDVRAPLAPSPPHSHPAAGDPGRGL